jgi:hypothetical protein
MLAASPVGAISGDALLAVRVLTHASGKCRGLANGESGMVMLPR